jgi:threonine/homoserine/homoserine lactone efflux protein
VPDGSTLLLFAGTSLALLAVPGPAVIYVVTRSLDQGRAAGIVSMLGVETGTFAYALAAAAGLTGLIAASQAGFTVVKYAGAAYLIYLGVQRLLGREQPQDQVSSARSRLFLRGLLVQLLNPKIAIFFLAFLPQFVDPSMAVAPQVLVLGAEFIAIAVISDGAYAVVAGTLGERVGRSAATNRWVDRAAGGALIGLGGVAALSGGPDDHHRAGRVV